MALTVLLAAVLVVGMAGAFWYGMLADVPRQVAEDHRRTGRQGNDGGWATMLVGGVVGLVVQVGVVCAGAAVGLAASGLTARPGRPAVAVD